LLYVLDEYNCEMINVLLFLTPASWVNMQIAPDSRVITTLLSATTGIETLLLTCSSSASKIGMEELVDASSLQHRSMTNKKNMAVVTSKSNDRRRTRTCNLSLEDTLL